MSKTRIYYFLIFLLFAVFVFFESLKPKPIDWSYNFSSTGKMPYGCYALSKLLPHMSKNKSVFENFDNFYAWKNSYYLQSGKSLIIINEKFAIDSIEYEILYDHVAAGNKVFIAAESFNQVLKDSLKIETKYDMPNFMGKNENVISFNEPKLADGKKFRYVTNSHHYFSRFDTSKTSVLASDSAGHPVFIKIQDGNGAFYISSTPVYFTNFHMLYSNSEYALKCLSFIEGANIIWDEYYKPNGGLNLKSSSPLRYILSKAALKWSYYLLLFTAILFLIFEGKRRQRYIPFYGKPQNHSLEFTRTVAMLFFNQRKYKNLADKRMAYFNDFVYTKYKVRFDENDATCIEILAERASVPETLLTRIVNRHKWLKQQKEISESEAYDYIDVTNRFFEIIKGKK